MMAYGAILGQSFESSPVLNDYYTKQQTLSATTAAIFGLGTDAVPDDVLATARSLISTAQSTADTVTSRLKVITGSYTGTKINGESSKRIPVTGYPMVLLLQRERIGSVGQLAEPVSSFIRSPGTGALFVSSAPSSGNSVSTSCIYLSVNFGSTDVNLSGTVDAVDSSDYKYYYTVLCLQ